MSEHNYVEWVEKNSYKIINCSSCRFWHVYPIPTEGVIDEYYRKKYYENLGDNRSMTDKISDPDGFYRIQYEDKLRRIEKFLPKGLPLSVLDIGAGYGDFLSFMSERGWKTSGIEPSELNCEISNNDGLGIRRATFSDLSNMDLPISSVVTLNNVMEHLREPAEVLTSVRNNLLDPHGILNIYVPNDFSFLQRLVEKTVLKDRPDKQNFWLYPPEHLNYWTHVSLKEFLIKCGFEVLYLTSTFPLELFILMGMDYISNPEVGREMHLKRVLFEKNLFESGSHDFKDSLCEHFAQLGIGRGIEVFAVPKNSKSE